MAGRDRKLPSDDTRVHLQAPPRERSSADLDPDLKSRSNGRDSSFQVSQHSNGPKVHQAKVENTYKLGPDRKSDTEFSACAVERVCEATLVDHLQDCQYDPVTCRKLSQELAAIIMERIKELKLKRYKLVAVVSIGSLKERPGLQFGSRCLWNHETDSFATVKFTNGSLFAVAMVYGLYYE